MRVVRLLLLTLLLTGCMEDQIMGERLTFLSKQTGKLESFYVLSRWTLKETTNIQDSLIALDQEIQDINDPAKLTLLKQKVFVLEGKSQALQQLNQCISVEVRKIETAIENYSYN